jgi:hypothetical protein
MILAALPIASWAQAPAGVATAHQRFAEDFNAGHWDAILTELWPDAELTIIEAGAGEQGKITSVVRGSSEIVTKLQQIRTEHMPLRLSGCQPLEANGALCTYEVPQRMKFFTGTKLRGERFCCVMVGMKGL